MTSQKTKKSMRSSDTNVPNMPTTSKLYIAK